MAMRMAMRMPPRARGQGGAAPDPYMIASNRFSIATDWGIGSSAFADGGAMQGINGGKTSVLYRYFYRRLKFSTGTWAPKAGKFLFSNAAMGTANLFYGLFDVTIQRAEVRTTGGTLVDTLEFSGSGSKVLAAGENIWTDAIVDLSANTTYYLDLYWTCPDHASFPSGGPPQYLSGESAGAHLSTNYSLGSMPSNGISSSFGGMFAPSMFVAKGHDGAAPVVLILGDSIADYTNVTAALAPARGDIGFIQKALGDASGEVMNCWSMARYSAATTAHISENVSGLGGVAGLTWLKTVTNLLQTEPLFNAVIDEHGRNNMGAALTQQKTWLASTIAKFQADYPGADLPYFKVTCPPLATQTNLNGLVSEASQTAGAVEQAGGIRNQWNDWIIAGGDGQVDGCFDTANVCRGVDYGKWKVRAFSTTLLDAITANSATTVRLNNAPALGQMLVFEPTDATNYDAGGSQSAYCVVSVTAAGGGGWNVGLHRASRTAYAYGTAGYAGRVVKAHAAGVTVAAYSSRDLTHPDNETQDEMSAVVVAGKAAISAAVAA